MNSCSRHKMSKEAINHTMNNGDEKPAVPDSHRYSQTGHEGWLLKYGTNRKWQKRYFTLKGSILSYWNDEKKQGKPKVSVNVNGASLLTLSHSDYDMDNCFAVIPINAARSLVLSGVDTQDRATWTTVMSVAGGAHENTNSFGISDGRVDQRSLAEDYVELTVGGTKLGRHYVVVLKTDLQVFAFKCDATPLYDIDLTAASTTHSAASTILTLNDGTKKQFAFQLHDAVTVKEWDALLRKVDKKL